MLRLNPLHILCFCLIPQLNLKKSEVSLCVSSFSFGSKMPSHHSTTTRTKELSKNRRLLLTTIIAIPLLWDHNPEPSHARGVPKLNPDVAFNNLLKAQEELLYAQKTYLPKKDFQGLREYLSKDATYMNNYEADASALLYSEKLDIESKKAIGTIRRFGVGADVIIMYGGLKGEIDEENEDIKYSEVQKYLRRTLDSLNEIVLICRSNGFK